ncbi:MAG: ParA family protein, partial [Oscillospiraceae bacterium]
TAADGAIVPIKIDRFALDGLDYLISTIYEIKSEFNEKLNFLGSFVTMDNCTSVNKEIKHHLHENAMLKMYSTSIKTNVKVPESTFSQLPVVYYDAKSTAGKAYRELTNEILSRGI